MREIIIKVPNSKFDFVVELIKNLGMKFDLKHDEKEDFKVHGWHKDLVQSRIKTASPQDYIPWEDALKQIKRK